VLSGSDHPVSDATRRRVLAAADELEYSPSALARALVTRNSRIIGVIVGDIVDPYFAEIARGVDDVARSRGFLTMVCNADRSTGAELDHLRILRNYHAAGIVFAGSGFHGDPQAAKLRSAVQAARAAGATVVALATREVDSTVARVDNHAAAYDVTTYLISLGHRAITFVDGPEGLFTSEQRLAGYAQAMADAALDPRTVPGGFEYEAGYEAVLRIFAAGSIPDAIVGANDEVAIGVLRGLRQAGVDVPADVSVAGIDDTRPARFVDLTTVSVPLYELGATAARAIVDGRVDESEVVLSHRLVARSTTTRRRS
jgi:LacI family transcriptional regulator